MKENSYNLILELEKKVVNYENKVKYLESLIDLIKKDIKSEVVNIDLDYKNSSVYANSEIVQLSTSIELNTNIFLKIIIESMPFPVFIKDENSTYLLINSLESKLFGLHENEIIGKNDGDFISDLDELTFIKETDEQVLKSNKAIELPSQNFTLANGSAYSFKTHKIPFFNPITEKINILGFSMDVTDSVQLSHLKKIVLLCSNPFI